MNWGCFDSAFNLRSYILSLLQFRLVQKISQFMFAKAMVQIGSQGSLDVAASVVYEYIKNIVVVLATILGWGGCFFKMRHGIHSKKIDKDVRQKIRK